MRLSLRWFGLVAALALAAACEPEIDYGDEQDMMGGPNPSGVDIRWRLEGRRLGIQVDTMDAVESVAWYRDGVLLRAPETAYEITAESPLAATWAVLVTTRYGFGDTRPPYGWEKTWAVLDIPGAFTPVPDPGQTLCYDGTQAVPCATAMPQDAHRKHGPAPRFTAVAGGVRDAVTELVWQDPVANGTACSGDWRLPTLDELRTLERFAETGPELPPPFVDRPSTLYLATYFERVTAQSISPLRYCRPEADKPAARRCVRGGREVKGAAAYRGDDVVVDYATGLWWQATGISEVASWSAALAACDALELAGHADWRLPDEWELRSAPWPYVLPVARAWSATTAVCDPTRAMIGGRSAAKNITGLQAVCVRGN